MSLLKKIGSAFGTTGASILQEVGQLVDRFIHTKEEKNAFRERMESLIKKHEVDLIAAYNNDRANARALQREALQQNDRFSKRFVYYLAGFWSIASIVYIFTITFFNVLNERIADTIVGFLMGTIVSTIINYFYGSSLKPGLNKKER